MLQNITIDYVIFSQRFTRFTRLIGIRATFNVLNWTGIYRMEFHRSDKIRWSIEVIPNFNEYRIRTECLRMIRKNMRVSRSERGKLNDGIRFLTKKA